MPSTPTPILQLTVPTVGGDANSWGSEINGDLVIIDNLGATAIFPVSSNYNAVISPAPRTLIRVTTAALVVTVTLPTPSTNAGKSYIIKKVDSGSGSVHIVGTIDGVANFDITTQNSFVEVMSNGVTYDIVGSS